MDADYGKNLLGIHVANGPWGENFHWDAYYFATTNPAASDLSEPMRRRLVRYVREKYGNDVSRLRDAWKDASLTFEAVKVPGAAQRRRPVVHGPPRRLVPRPGVDRHGRAHEEVVRRLDAVFAQARFAGGRDLCARKRVLSGVSANA